MNDVCPVISACLSHIRQRYDKEQGIDGKTTHLMLQLTDRQYSVRNDPYHTRLRGFIAVEKMLGMLDLIMRPYARHTQIEVPSYQLVSRSWGGLTVAYEALNEFMEELKLDQTELHLSGIRVVRDWKGRNALNARTRGNNLEEPVVSMAMKGKAVAVNQLETVCPLIRSAIKSLRPYLGNPEAPIKAVGHGLARVMEETDPPYSILASLYSLNDLYEVRI